MKKTNDNFYRLIIHVILNSRYAVKRYTYRRLEIKIFFRKFDETETQSTAFLLFYFRFIIKIINIDNGIFSLTSYRIYTYLECVF